jgi:group I intron endonuclease
MKQYNYIYKTVNQVNGKYYIGMHSTNSLNDNYIGSGIILRYSIEKYGVENFKKEIIEFLPDRNSLKCREKQIISEELIQDKMCMNIAQGGEGGNTFLRMSDERKQEAFRKRSDSMKGKNLGKTCSELQKEKIRKSLKGNTNKSGSILTVEQKISCGNGRRGKKNSDSWKEKVCKKIIQMDLNMQVIKEWNSSKDAADYLQISAGNISAVCNNHRKTASNFKWKWYV